VEKEVTADISIFRTLDRIRQDHDIRDIDWAQQSGVGTNRISEYRKMAHHERAGGYAGAVWGRQFTLNKCIALVRGLRILVGGSQLRNALRKEVKSLPMMERIIFRVAGMSPGELAQVESLLDVLQMERRVGKSLPAIASNT
jgi:hypothetical protein